MLQQVRDKIRNRCSQLRAVQRISETKDFAAAYDKASEYQRAKLILISTSKELRVWMALVTNSPLSSLSYRKLRDMAKNDNVFNYSRLPRDELITQLEKLRERKLEPGKGPDRGIEKVCLDVGCPGTSNPDA